MAAGGTEATPESYLVTCPSCCAVYDAALAVFCSCIVSVRTPACPGCGACLCTQPKERQRAFWAGAPPSLWQQRLAQNRPREAGGVFRPAEPLDTRRPLVLIADDEPDALRVASRLIRSFGYGVIPARDGEEAFAAALRFCPDLILTDAMMPHLDGRALSLKVKADPALAATKVVLMTGLFLKDAQKSEAYREFRVDAYLRKPVRPEELEALLGRLLAPASPSQRTDPTAE